MSLKRLLLNCTILGFLAGAFAGSLVVTHCLGIFMNNNLGVSLEVSNDVIILDALQKGEQEQALFWGETALTTDITTLSWVLKDVVSGADRERARDALLKIAHYRAEYPVDKKETDSATKKEVDKIIEQILNDALLKAEPPQPAS